MFLKGITEDSNVKTSKPESLESLVMAISLFMALVTGTDSPASHTKDSGSWVLRLSGLTNRLSLILPSPPLKSVLPNSRF